MFICYTHLTLYYSSSPHFSKLLSYTSISFLQFPAQPIHNPTCKRHLILHSPVHLLPLSKGISTKQRWAMENKRLQMPQHDIQTLLHPYNRQQFPKPPSLDPMPFLDSLTIYISLDIFVNVKLSKQIISMGKNTLGYK